MPKSHALLHGHVEQNANYSWLKGTKCLHHVLFGPDSTSDRLAVKTPVAITGDRGYFKCSEKADPSCDNQLKFPPTPSGETLHSKVKTTKGMLLIYLRIFSDTL